MKPLVIALFSITLLDIQATYAKDSVIEKDIRSHCRAEWEDNYRMQKHCIETQSNAVLSVFDYADRYDVKGDAKSSPYAKIFKNCLGDWRSDFVSGGYNWRMVDYCINNQLEAYKELYD